MNRRNFINKSGKTVLGGMLFPWLDVNNTTTISPIIAKMLPIIRKFVERVVIAGLEDYARDKLVNWLGKQFENKKETKKEADVFAKKTEINLYNNYETNVFMGLSKNQFPSLSVFPTMKEVNGQKPTFKILTEDTYVPFFGKTSYIENLNFVEMLA